MKIFFKTRELVRQHPLVKSGKGKAVDCGTDKPIGKRWAIEVPLKARGGFFKGNSEKLDGSPKSLFRTY